MERDTGSDSTATRLRTAPGTPKRADRRDRLPNAEQDGNSVDSAILDMMVDEANAAPDYRCTLLPDGMPIRAFFRHSAELPWQRRWIGHFTISPDIESEFAGMPIIAAWNPPQLGRRLSPRHNLARDYRAVTGLSARPMFPKKHGHRAILGMFLLDAARHSALKSQYKPMWKSQELGANFLDSDNPLISMVRREGVEPPTLRFEERIAP